MDLLFSSSYQPLITAEPEPEDGSLVNSYHSLLYNQLSIALLPVSNSFHFSGRIQDRTTLSVVTRNIISTKLHLKEELNHVWLWGLMTYEYPEFNLIVQIQNTSTV